jgi:tRNA A37 threonylcarbamoyladenosine dehydratase
MSTVLPLPSLSTAEAADIDFERRFGGIARLYGDAALAAFRQAHVCVIGVGGVGSWAVEALARSAIGRITLIDLDHLAESNVNRQIHALTDTLGQAKVTALAERIAQINPFCEVSEVEEFVTEENITSLIVPGRFDFVIDAIDNARAKTALVVHCRAHQIPLVTIGSAGGQTDPTQIAIIDLSRTEQEPLLARVRKRLRAHHGFPRGTKNKFGVDAVYSTEPLRHPELCATDEDAPGITGLNCAGYGSAVVVTASFGFVAAGYVLRKLSEKAEKAVQT